MGSLSGASASGYLALPMTSANRSPRLSAATDGTRGATDNSTVTTKARRIFIRQRSSEQGADTSLRLGDLTLRKPHYQTGRANRQPLATPHLIATINHDKAHRRRRNKSGSGLSLATKFNGDDTSP